ncbi:MAG: 3-hydroxyacyl-CoA dehydrogenase NAD-binding domain-containing protein [Verrucomicrobiales bacterium]|nr:3-hydroxyacyl-CoA dehydrogenase NAD-binding domain-containing protein [Verrucomicrobiales bacterium]
MITEAITTPVADHPGGGGKRRLPHVLHLEIGKDNIGTVVFDRPGKSANIFDEATLDELKIALKAVESLRPKAVIFKSAKPTIFIAGADLDSLAGATKENLQHLIEKGQEVFQQVAALPMPTLAAIHGACLGGGLELALACDQRIASSDRSTRIGLPETLLGIIPAWGGSTRLPRLIGLPKALGLILSGKAFTAKHAGKLGLVDAVVPAERLLEVSEARVLTKPERKRFFLTNNCVSGFVIRVLTKRRLLKKTRGNYPAGEAAVEVVTRGASGSIVRSLLREQEAVQRLAGSDATKNLMRLFRLQERARKFRYAPDLEERSFAGIERTAVIGAGVMGSGIAQWFSARGFPVILRDIDCSRVSAGMESVRRLFESAVRKRILTKHESMRRLDLVTPSAEPVSLGRCDLVVEAAVENLAIKKKIFADLCERSAPDTILATNTSALPISELCTADGITHPERIVGLHFFNPVSRMKLVEVVVTVHTSPEVVERVLAFVRKIGKLPVVVKDSPGFLVNRILMPYLIEAGHLVDGGVSPEVIDEAMLDFGMPMGPIRLIDEVGLDVAAHVAVTMRESFGDRFELPRVLTRLVKEERFGRKVGHGFYTYGKGRVTGGAALPGKAPSSAIAPGDIANHLAGLMVKEAKLCLAEGIARDADDIDLAMVLGTGFAPFRGGPLAWGRSQKESSPGND